MIRLPRLFHSGCAAAFTLALSGCIPYPAHKTLQPQSAITVQDEAGRPVADARVVLIAAAYPYGYDRYRNEQRTDAEGRASFEARQEWRVETLAIHGAQVFFWNWCVEKPGYVTHATHERNAEAFDPRPVVRLRAGESTTCDNPRGSPFMRDPPAAARPGQAAPARESAGGSTAPPPSP